jgi:alpha-glucoside transport system permease protein
MTAVLEPKSDAADAKAFQEPVGRSVAASLTGRTGRVLVWVLVIFWTIPTFGLFVSSIRPELEVKSNGWWNVFIDPAFTFSNYPAVWGSADGGDNLSQYFLNTLRITIPSVIISVGLAALAAYAFAWIEFKGRDWLYTAVISMLIVPLQTAIIPLLQLFTGGAHIGSIPIFPDLNLSNNIITIWIAHTCFGMPFCIFLLKNFMSALPKEVMEAARIDGAGHLTLFRKVVLPLSVPALASLAIFQFVYIFNDLLIGKVFGGTKNTPLIARLVDVAGSRGQSWHLLTAAAVISMVLPMAVFFSLQRYFVRGLLAGAVKG